jgi:hypothetical protein
VRRLGNLSEIGAIEKIENERDPGDFAGFKN